MGGGRDKSGTALYVRRNGRYVRNAAYKNPDREEVRQSELERKRKLGELYKKAIERGMYNIYQRKSGMYQDVLDNLYSLAGIPVKDRTFENTEKNMQIVNKKLGLDIVADRISEYPTAKDIEEVEREFEELTTSGEYSDEDDEYPF